MTEEAIARLVTADDILGFLKKGASAIWDQRHTLFPTIAPIIDKAVATAKTILPQIMPMVKEVKQAIITDHEGVTDRLLKTATNMVPSLSNFTPFTAMPNQVVV